MSALNDAEQQSLKRIAASGTRIVVTGKDATGMAASSQVVRFETCPAAAYLAGLRQDFLAASQKMPKDFLQAMEMKDGIEVDAPPTVAVNLARVEGTPHVFLANFEGLVPHKIAIPAPAERIHIRIPADIGDRLAYLPFLGEVQILQGTKHGDHVEFALPPVERSAAVWAVARN